MSILSNDDNHVVAGFLFILEHNEAVLLELILDFYHKMDTGHKERETDYFICM